MKKEQLAFQGILYKMKCTPNSWDLLGEFNDDHEFSPTELHGPSQFMKIITSSINNPLQVQF